MSRLVGHLLRLGARVLERAGLVFYRLGTLLHNGLPVVLTPRDSTTLLARYYNETYYAESSGISLDHLAQHGYELEPWELDLCRRYGLDGGRALVLGCGWGRESIALAERGVSVVGLDLHGGVVAQAQQAATDRGLPAGFLRGDFLAPPCKPNRFDVVLLSGTMYSAIPGRTTRQAWLSDIRRVLTREGVAILSFQADTRTRGRLESLGDALTRVLRALPGSNPAYQAGDVCQAGHFFHLFQHEAELKEELHEAGAVIRELCWPKPYVVLSFPAGS